MNPPATTFGSPSGEPNITTQTDASANVPKTLDTTAAFCEALGKDIHAAAWLELVDKVSA